MNSQDFKGQMAKKNLGPKSIPHAYIFALFIGALGLQQIYLGKYKSWLWRYCIALLIVVLAFVLPEKAPGADFLRHAWLIPAFWLCVNVVVDWFTLWRQVMKVNERLSGTA
jgi:hypothetical protein